jgi:hypothetical protein
MGKIVLTVTLVLVIIFIVPVAVYGLTTLVTDLKTPGGVSPAQFLTSVLVSKVGTAIAFVLLFYFARNALSAQWLLYGGIWLLMFVADEIGQAIGPKYSWTEAIAGIISETAYMPLSAYVTYRLIGVT